MKKEELYLFALLIFTLIGQLLIYLQILQWINIPRILGYIICLSAYSGDLYMYFKIKEKI